MYNGTTVIDIHGHMSTPPEFTVHSANLVNQRKLTAGSKFSISDERLDMAQQQHLEFMNVRDIEYQLISPRPVHMWHWETPVIQHSWCETTNDVIAQIVKLHPDRLGGMAQLPQNVNRSTKDVVDELDRAINQLGFLGAIVNPDPGADAQTPGMDDEEYWYPLYERAEKLGAVLMVHASISRDKRIWNVPQNYQVNNVIGQFLATLALEHGRVFQDFPNLRVFVSHLGGALNRFIMTDESHYFGNKNIPNLTFDTCAHDVDFLTAGLRQKTLERCMFGSEAPGAGSGAKRPETGRPADDLVPVIKDMDWITEPQKIDLFYNNAKKFFPLADRFPV
jgi:predicted TIM-barrel fold metal-dependent hydrolase